MSALQRDHTEWLRQGAPERQKHYVWLLIQGGDEKAAAALTAEGELWTAKAHHHLPSLHETRGSITQLVARTAGHLLP